MATPFLESRMFLLCITPTASNFSGAALAAAEGDWLVQTGLMWVTVPLLAAAAFSAFIAYYNDRVPNRVAWVTILLNGAITIGLFAALHAHAGLACAAAACDGAVALPSGGPAVYHDVWTALYYSTVTFTTLGYGDIQPLPAMRMLAAIEAIIGYLYLGMLVGAAIHWAGTYATVPSEDDPPNG